MRQLCTDIERASRDSAVNTKLPQIVISTQHFFSFFTSQKRSNHKGLLVYTVQCRDCTQSFDCLFRFPQRHFRWLMLQLGTGSDRKRRFPLHPPVICFCIHIISMFEREKKKVHIFLSLASVELNQILWINLIAVKNDINLWIGHIVHTAVVKVSEAGVLRRWSAVHRMADCVFPDEHSGQEHGLVGRLAGKYRRGESVSLQGGVVLPRGVTELTRVLGIPGEVAPCRERQVEWDVKIQTKWSAVNLFMMLHHNNTEGSTFAIDIAMAPSEPPVKVKCTYSLYVAVSCAMKQHSLLNIQCALDFSQLCFLP